MENKMPLPPGFRFHPTDEELAVHYLAKRSDTNFGANVIAQVDLYKHDPWDLPALAYVGEKEWYFLTPRDRKYPNGARPNRAAASGYWKATGTDKPIFELKSGALVGSKKALVFYHGKPSQGVKTNWIMHEYRLPGSDSDKGSSSRSLRMDDWVLCRIYEKSSGSAYKTHDSPSPKIEICDDPVVVKDSTTFGDFLDTLDPLDVDTSVHNKVHHDESLMSTNVLPKHKFSHIQSLMASAMRQPNARDRFKRGIESLLKHHNTKQSSDESHSSLDESSSSFSSLKRFRII